MPPFTVTSELLFFCTFTCMFCVDMKLMASLVLVFVLLSVLSWIFSTCSHLMRYSGSWPCIHLQMQPCVGFPVSRRQDQVFACVCGCVGGRVGWYGGRRGNKGWREEAWKRGRRRHQRRGEIGSPRSDKAGRGVQRQRKRDPPRDRERHACPCCLAPFSFSLIQLYQAPAPRQALGPNWNCPPTLKEYFAVWVFCSFVWFSLMKSVVCVCVCVCWGGVILELWGFWNFSLVFVVWSLWETTHSLSPTCISTDLLKLFYSITTSNKRKITPH